MAKMTTDYTITLELTRREFTLITKGLIGKLQPAEIQEAKDFCLTLMNARMEDLEIKTEAATHALHKAQET
jgi:hypothetical protein